MEAPAELIPREVDIVLLSQSRFPSRPLVRINCSVAVRAGARYVLPLALGLVPLGLVVGAGAFAAIAAALTANARCSMYSAALASALQSQPRWFRWGAPYFLDDPVYAVMAERITKEKRPTWLRHYYLAAGAVVWVVWQTTVAVGIVVGDALVERLPLDVAVAALFIGVLVPGISTRVAVIAAVTALLVAGAGAGLPNGFGLVAGAAAGVLAATAVERRLS